MELKDLIRNVPGFPVAGIQFKDITTLIKDRQGFREAVDWMVSRYSDKGIDKVVAVESRGFIFGAPVALELNAGFVPVRKKGKLPAQTLSVEYELEYGTDTLEIHKDALERGEKVLIVDDLLATGGTTEATAELIEKTGGEVAGICVLIELTGLKGRARLEGYPLEVLIQYDEK